VLQASSKADMYALVSITHASLNLVQADSRKDYLGGHEHLSVEAHLGSKELGPEMFAMDGQA